MKTHWRGIISIVFVMIIWGSTFAITKVALSGIKPMLFAFLRFLVASAVLLVLILLRRKSTQHEKKTPVPLLPIMVMGACGITAFYIFFNLSLLYTSTSSAALIQGFIPASIALLAALFLKERLSGLQIGGIVLSVAGIMLISMLADSAPGASDSLKGNLYMMVAVIAWAVYTVLSKKVAAYDHLQTTAWVTFAGTMFLAPFAVAENWNTGLPQISQNGWLSIIYLGAVASALSYLLYNKALENLTATQVGIFINLDPVVGLAIALLFLKEHINMWQIAGGVLVLVGIVLSMKFNKENTGV